MTALHPAVAAAVRERPAGPADEAFFRRLFADDRRPEFLAAGLPAAEVERLLADQFRLQTIGYGQAFPNADRRVILLGEVPVGRIIEDTGPDEIRVVDLVLLPVHRGRGIGSEVLDRVVFRSQLRRLPIRLQALLGSPAVGLYLRRGFEPEGTTVDRVQLVRHP